LINTQLTEGVYTAILNIVQSDEFKCRYTDDLSVVFSDIKDIHEYDLSSDKNDDLAMMISPTFKGSLELITRFITESKANSEVVGDTSSITVVLDVSEVNGLTESTRNKMIAEYEAIFSATVEISRVGLMRQPDPDTYDAYFISKLTPFTTSLIKKLDALEMLDKYVYCRRELPIADLPNMLCNNPESTLTAIELVMAAATKFTYVKMAECFT